MVRRNLRVADASVERGVVQAAFGYGLRRVLERPLATVRELHRHDGLVRALVVALLGVRDVGSAERRTVADHPPTVGLRGVGLSALLLVAQHDDARRHFENLRARPLLVGQTVQELFAVALVGPTIEQLVRELVERVVAGARVWILVERRAFGGALDGVVLPGDGALAAIDEIGIRPAILVEDVRFPVVENHLGGGADLLGHAIRVFDAGKVDFKLILAGNQQFRLGDAELVDAVAHDLQRALKRFFGDHRYLLGRLGPVDQLHAALKIEAQAGLPGSDDRDRNGDQPENGEQDEKAPAAIGHEI